AEGGATTLTEQPTAKRTRVELPPAAATTAPAAPPAKPAEPAAKPVAKATDKAQPLFAAPEGARDDLKMISGVGPVLEGKLNAIGITTWAQVAALEKAEIAKLEDHLSFPGRIARDEWIKQAKALAKGGIEEYRKVFGKDPR